VTKLSSAQGERKEQFGDRVALSADGSTALVGASQENEQSEDPGADTGWAYVFTRSDGTWTQETQLSPPDDGGADSFGYAVALSADGTTALVGDYESGDPDGDGRTGAAYRFERAGGDWSQLPSHSCLISSSGGFSESTLVCDCQYTRHASRQLLPISYEHG